MQVFKNQPSGFSLTEVILVLAILSFLLSIVLLNVGTLKERLSMVLAANRVTQTLKQAQFLALTQHRSHALGGVGSVIWVERSGRPAKTILQESLPDDIRITANRWPRFSPFGFARSGTIALTSKHFQLQIVIGPIGSIRQTEMQIK